jgi:hypothetical protein
MAGTSESSSLSEARRFVRGSVAQRAICSA